MKPTFKMILWLAICILDQQIAKPQFDALPDSNAQWKVDYVEGSDYYYSNYYWISDIDTMIDGSQFHILPTNEFINDNESGQVYIHSDGETHLLYDFDVEVGDTVFDVFIREMPVQDMQIISVDTVSISGKYRKRIGIEDIDGSLSSETQYWIQGIGGTGGLLTTCNCIYPPSPILVCMSANDTIQLGFDEGYPGHCFQINDIDVEEISFKDRIAVFPNPSTGLFHLGQSAEQISLYNAQGRLLFQQYGREVDLSAYPPGVYTAVVQTARGNSAQRLVVVR